MKTHISLLSRRLVIAVLIGLLASVAAAVAENVRFKKIVVDKVFRSEGVATGDVNRDGKRDIFAGDVWYEAPGWKRHELRPVGKYNPQKGYSKCFANFSGDVNGDGWVDSIIVNGWNNCPCYWYENPKGKPGHWKQRLVTKSAGNETPLFDDLLSTGKPVAIFAARRQVAWLAPPGKSDGQWSRHVVNSAKDAKAASDVHTFGMGDVNGDGRADILVAKGWFEAPKDRTQGNWAFHPVPFGSRCANLIAHDFDGDGDPDVLASSAHSYGIWWFEQTKTAEGIKWIKRVIYKEFSQTHALILADINRDGRMDFVTGKRYYAHNGRDPGGKEPVVLYWFERTGPAKGPPQFTPHLIDSDSGIGTQFEVTDMNGDKRLDIVTSNKKGVHVFMQTGGGGRVGRVEKTVSLFDGKTFNGWEGNLKAFRIADGAIVGGTLKRRIPRNEFLCTKKRYGDFELRLKCRLLGKGANAGIQIRTERIPNHHEVRGYQADMGGRNDYYWGALYDESRRNKILAKPDKKTLAKALKRGDWNEYVIRCAGPKIQLFLNGVKTVDYTEPDAKIARTGIIGLQIHGGPPSEAWYKDITIRVIGK